MGGDGCVKTVIQLQFLRLGNFVFVDIMPNLNPIKPVLRSGD